MFLFKEIKEIKKKRMRKKLTEKGKQINPQRWKEVYMYGSEVWNLFSLTFKPKKIIIIWAMPL